MLRRRHGPPRPDDRHGPIETVDDTNFTERTAGQPTVVDLWARWCAPCRSLRPILERVAADWGDRVRFTACNVDENPDTAMALQVRSIPTVVAFGADGREVDRIVGVPSPADLEAFVAQLAGEADGQQAG